MPPRGGSGNGAQAATIALVAGHGGRAQAPAPSSGPATIPGYLASPPPGSTAGANVPPPVVTRNAAAGQLAQEGAGSSGSAASAAGLPSVGTATGPTVITENPSSRPSSTAGNGSRFSQMSFPYFPLYVLDQNDGIVLFNGQTQQASLNGVVELDAQVQGTSVSSYSWTTSGLNITSSSGASTYAFQFQLTGSLISPEDGSVTLTVTNTSSQQESETFYFIVPTTNVVNMPTTASWPTTIPPDLEAAGAPSIASQGVSVDADSGALNTNIDLPSYNPTVPALSLT